MGDRIFIVRHGNTFEAGEPARRIGSGTDLPLVERGRQQAAAIGDWLSDRHIRPGRILTSPLVRCRETAAIIGCSISSHIAIAPWLNEIDHGPDEGEPEAAVIARVGEAALRRWDECAIPPADWHVDPVRRGREWTTLFAAPPPGDTIVVTSNGMARFALLAIEPQPDRPLKLATGALGVLRRSRLGEMEVAAWNLRPEAAAGAII